MWLFRNPYRLIAPGIPLNAHLIPPQENKYFWSIRKCTTRSRKCTTAVPESAGEACLYLHDRSGCSFAQRFLARDQSQLQRDFCLPLVLALDRLHWLNSRTISGWKSCAIFRIVCRRRKPNGPCRRSTSGSSTKRCSNFRNSSGLRTRTFSNRRRISIRSWKPSGGKAFLSPNMKIVSTAPWRRPSVPRLVMKTLRWRVHRSHLLPIRRPTLLQRLRRSIWVDRRRVIIFWT